MIWIGLIFSNGEIYFEVFQFFSAERAQQAFKTFSKYGDSLLARSSKLQSTLAEIEGEGLDKNSHTRVQKYPDCKVL